MKAGIADLQDYCGYNSGSIFASGAVEDASLIWLVSYVPQNRPESGAPVVQNLGVQLQECL